MLDEVITSGGYREPINLQQIRTNLEMESHEEKLHNMIKISKIESAKDQANDAAKVIRQRQREAQKLGIGMQGIGSGDAPSESGNPYGSNSNLSSMSSGPSSTSSTSLTAYDTPASSLPDPTSTRKVAAPLKGMALSAKNSKNKSLEDALVKEDKLAPVLATSAASKSSSAAVVEAPIPVIQQPVMLAIVEKLSAKISRDGVIESYDIRGSLTLTANNDESGLCSVQMKLGSNASLFTFNTHPKINKSLYDRNGLLQLKDISKGGFPSARPVGILKWTYSSTSDDLIPLKINCWPEEESRNRMIVSMEYTMENPSLTLHDVEIKIPLGTSESLSVANIDGTYKHSSSAAEVAWQIPLIDSSNSSGSFEFTIPQKQSDAFFPITVSFTSSQLLCSIDVTTVTNPNTSIPIQYGLTKFMGTEEYTIE